MSYKRNFKHKKKAAEKKAGPDYSDLIGETDLSNKNVHVYLVKMPDFLAEEFADPRNRNQVIGRLRIPDPNDPRTSTDPSIAQPRIFLDKVSDADLPNQGTGSVEFNLNIQRKNPNIMVFSSNRKEQKDNVRIEGNVSVLCQARPKMDATYRAITRRRSKLANQPKHGILRMEDSERNAADRIALRPISMAETAKQREEKKKAKEDSRRHLDVPDEKWRESARASVFQAFEIKSHYSADELAQAIGEKTSRIRPIIGEVCSYNKSGPFSGKYELKDEFKTVSQRQQKERELEDYRLQQVEMARKRREKSAQDKDEQPAKKARQF